ncbi:MAG: YcaO-like family protein [Deltaproteobacteria bacterium]|nr:YcaO-like family protein [Deltaproteobacteria bacterium]
MKYTLSRVGTGMGVGWFACVPDPQPTFQEALCYAREHPNDLFMHQHFLNAMRELDSTELESLILTARNNDNHLLALTYETCILNTKFDPLKKHFHEVDVEELTAYSPLIVIPSFLEKNGDQHFYWLKQFSANANLLRPLPSPNEAEFPLPFDRDAIDQWKRSVIPVKDIFSHSEKKSEPPDGPPLKEVTKHLRNRLEQLGILTGWDMRTEATLSPFAVERPWNLHIQVEDGRNQWELSGTQTGYGRGLNISQGRISCLMEIVERYSAFATVRSGRVIGYKNDDAMIKGTYEDLTRDGIPALHPNDLCLEVPYREQELWWIRAERLEKNGVKPVFVPAQMVFLFSNLDEISLTSGLSSNGFAAGNTLEAAKLSALLEVIERDAEKVVPYTKGRSFLLKSDDMKVSDILESNLQKGIQIQFSDMTPEIGIPCYKAFVQGPGGVILKGTGAHLDGKRALLSAMTEIPYPYPYSFGSMPPPEGLGFAQYEDLPDYASNDPATDLALVERVLIQNGYTPVYVDLTREDLGIPVVKAMVPGLEIMTVLDRFSPLSLRQFGHYLARS